MMLLIKLCCLISSSEMPQTSLEQPSAHFIVVIRLFPKSVIVGHFMRQKMMSIESSLFVCTSKVLLKENTNHPILLVSFILRVNRVRVLMLLDSERVLQKSVGRNKQNHWSWCSHLAYRFFLRKYHRFFFYQGTSYLFLIFEEAPLNH